MTVYHKSIIIFVVLLLAACTSVQPEQVTETPMQPSATALQPATSTPTIEPTATPIPPTATSTPSYPAEGYGPINFPAGINPLTGLKVEDSQILERRPVIVKVQNLPRDDRPHWGLSKADIIYEYYTEYGTTRFAAIFYGHDADQVAPIRSARFFDFNIIRAYKGMFIFGSAYETLYNKLVNAEFADRLMIESVNTSSVITRFDPGGKNYEMADTSKVNDYAKSRGIDISRPDLDGMFFQMEPPANGETVDQVYVRFSGAVYNRWDYDVDSNTYWRYVDAENAGVVETEKYELLVDRANDQPISADNLAVIYLRHEEIDPRPNVEVLNMTLLGTGKAYVMRDGKMYPVTWSRPDENSVLTFQYEDGTPFPLKPGNTWIEVVALNTMFEKQTDGAYRFSFRPDW